LSEHLDEVRRLGEGVKNLGGDGEDGNSEEVPALDCVVDRVVKPESVENN
jgi:hypothetical protein